MQLLHGLFAYFVLLEFYVVGYLLLWMIAKIWLLFVVDVELQKQLFKEIVADYLSAFNLFGR